eukprot:CAMPEP_0201482964 /NCGR_PEP_ID=MMETSP0151_2-20130828/7211_1 /ASSEMBLY_ACC=CAM_ASM_000257 /TAXON_ID=200890 /ORGANISM="Paramoeba atlantica, Strain 621/1 / CCAP 1560/9" /LENGTH=83 /DNA_ID=CAMNT_0047865895 /DNA_START=549 /DNA_END=797 /DNA_ORIENTATION=-
MASNSADNNEIHSSSYFSLLGFYRFAGSVVAADRIGLGRASKAQSSLGKMVNWDAELDEIKSPVDSMKHLILSLKPLWSHAKS